MYCQIFLSSFSYMGTKAAPRPRLAISQTHHSTQLLTITPTLSPLVRPSLARAPRKLFTLSATCLRLIHSYCPVAGFFTPNSLLSGHLATLCSNKSTRLLGLLYTSFKFNSFAIFFHSIVSEIFFPSRAIMGNAYFQTAYGPEQAADIIGPEPFFFTRKQSL